MRKTTWSVVVFLLLAVAGCGGSGSFANKPRPASPVNVTVSVNNRAVSVSPASIGAGEVVFIVTNLSDQTQSVTIRPAGGAQSLASTGPINRQQTGQVTVDFNQPGDYSVSSSRSGGGTDAAVANQHVIQPALLHIGKARPSSSDQLLQP